MIQREKTRIGTGQTKPRIIGNKDGQGFCITFENGWAISIQWHRGAYCDHKNGNAEVAVFDPSEEFFPLTFHDDVLGWQTPDEIAELISQVSQGRLGPKDAWID
tara:strand:- start:63 stop:374 length:312 start_codon:yes stop_codon:yes gene_type:complete